ncbi:protein kish-A isoform X1 [Equus caballus]|uniref:protein kish-A isoform X1 n=1 Tax=Equus caballus TaxID=9796 RepID=UPI0038B38391
MAGGSEEAGGACTPLPPWARKGDVAGASPASLWLLGIFWKCARIDKRYKFMNSATELNEEALKMTMTLKIFIGKGGEDCHFPKVVNLLSETWNLVTGKELILNIVEKHK